MSAHAPPLQPVTAKDVKHPAPQPDTLPLVTYMDFVPSPLKQGGVFTIPQYEEFGVLVQRANEWLAGNPAYTILTCESTESKLYHSKRLSNDDPYYIESEEQATCYIRLLRLWLKLRGSSDNPGPSQIGYLNVVPACLNTGGVISKPTFENFGTTIGKINEMLKSNPLPGKIVTIETQDIKFDKWKGSVNPDSCVWLGNAKHSKQFLNLIRIFYEVGAPANEQMGTVDFVPQAVSNTPEFQPFYSVVGMAHSWMKQNMSMNVVNVQSIDYKLTEAWGGGTLGTQRSQFRADGKYSTYYLRILRVCYTTGGPPRPPVNLTYRTFVPVQLTSGTITSLGKFETISQTMERAQAWIRLTGVKPVSAETVPVKVFMSQRGSAIEGSERTITSNSGSDTEIYMFVIRIYFDGSYHEPSAELLPPIPMIQSTGCNIL